MNQIQRILFILISLPFFLLTGCTFFGPVKTTPLTTYQLNKMPEKIPYARRHHVTVLLLSPTSDASYDTTQMAYTKFPKQMGYFGLNAWVATPAQMLMPLMIATLEETHAFHAVVIPPATEHYDYVISTQVIELRQVLIPCHPALVHLIVRVQLSSAASERVIATRTFVITEPLLSHPPYGGVLAANRATALFLHDYAVFCIHRLLR